MLGRASRFHLAGRASSSTRSPACPSLRLFCDESTPSRRAHGPVASGSRIAGAAAAAMLLRCRPLTT